MVDLGFLPGGNVSEARGVNADGTVVVGFGTAAGISSGEAFRWTQAGGMAGLGFLPGGSYSEANGVNADGTVVVGSSSASGTGPAFRWTQAGGMQSVQALLAAKGVSTTGWTLTSAQGVSADGQVIVGYGVDPSGRTQAWIARLGTPFLAFSATLTIDFGGPPPENTFNLHSSFTLSSTASNGIQSRYRAGHAPGWHRHHHFAARLLQHAQEWVFHLRRGDRWRELGRADQAHGHLALRVPSQGKGRELDRDHEPGAGDADHRRRQRHDLGHGPHCSPKRGLPRVIRSH